VANNQHSDAIEKAILEGLTSYEEYSEGDMLIEWVVVAYVANPSESTDGYPMFFSNGNMPPHRVYGLLHIGLKSIDNDDD
jgi:hypothetical protein